MTNRRQLLAQTAAVAAALSVPHIARAQQTPIRVLWWNASIERNTPGWTRKAMADHLNAYPGRAMQVGYHASTRKGGLAAQLSGGSFDVVVVDAIEASRTLNAADTDAVRTFYASGKRTLMLDGSFWIRSTDINQETRFPGPGDAAAGLLVNQIVAIAQNGGGILIGSDHNGWQNNSNFVLQALVPDAKFTGLTNPSTDGEFIGKLLLGQRERIRARDVLVHWESIPNQGEAPVGDFVDFTGAPIRLYSLVETADKPGGGAKRPYISSTIDPGVQRTAIDSEVIFENLPTHKSGRN